MFLYFFSSISKFIFSTLLVLPLKTLSEFTPKPDNGLIPYELLWLSPALKNYQYIKGKIPIIVRYQR